MKKKSTSFRLVALLNIVTLAVFRISVSFYLVYWAVSFLFFALVVKLEVSGFRIFDYASVISGHANPCNPMVT